MITLAEFIQKYDGKHVNFDDVYGLQCMDLYRQYVKEVLEFPQSPGVSIAYQVWARVAVNGFVCISIGTNQYVEVVKVEK